MLLVFIISIYVYQRLEKSIVFSDIPIEISANFLTLEYFAEIQEEYNQIRSENQRWYLLSYAKAIASHAIIKKMMLDLLDNESLLYENEQFNMFFSTFDYHVKQLPYLPEDIHFFRNQLNQYSGAPNQLNDMIELAACGKWHPFSATYHRYEVNEYDAAYNMKFVSENGRFEVVYNTLSGELINDPINMGTYNYAPGSIVPWKYYQHYIYDKLPWKKWGNTNEVSYKEITARLSRHGSIEQKISHNELNTMINTKTNNIQSCR